MKKLIMFLMVLAIATPAVALVYEPHSPGFAGCANSGQVVWEFLEDGCEPTSDQADPPYYFDPDLVNPVFGTRYAEGGPVWTWNSAGGRGQYTVEDTGAGTEDSLNQPIPDRGEKQYMRMYFEVTHTIVENDDPSFIGMGLELWDMTEWLGCPQSSDSGDGEYLEGYEFPPPTEQFDLGDGFYQSIWVADFSEDGSVYMEGFEGATFPGLFDATHTTAIIGMSDFGAEDFLLEEVYINYIWFNNADYSDIPTDDCVPIIGGGKKALEIDTVNIPIYEPQDAGGPAPMGPTSGTLRVKLNYKPGEDLGDPDFNCTVVVDPDPNQENVGSADFSFTNPVPPDPNGNVTLTFTQDNWDTFQDITVAATADLLREGNESSNILFTVTIDIADCNFGGPGCEDPVTQTKGIIVVDNDIPYISVLPADPCKPLEGTLSENDPCVPVCVNVRLSHLPEYNVDVFVVRESDYDILLDSMSIMDPPLGVADEPNRLTFTPGNYNVNQTICLTALDDEELVEAGLEWISGIILLNGQSKDIRYQSSEEGGELDELEVDFNVQDNECGAIGYNPSDYNEDCRVGLADFAHYYNEWLICTQPYEDGCDKYWNIVPE